MRRSKGFRSLIGQRGIALRAFVMAVMLCACFGMCILGCQEPGSVSEDMVESEKVESESVESALALEEKIVFERDGQIWIMNPDGSGQEQLTGEGDDRGHSLSPDGRYVVFSRESVSLHMISVDGSETIELIQNGLNTYRNSPSFSPKGSQICYFFRRKDDDMHGIAVLDVADGMPAGEKTVISERAIWDDFGSPCFSPDGRYIYFSSGGHGGPPCVALERVSVETGTREMIAAPEIREAEDGLLLGYRDFDFSPDGGQIACAVTYQESADSRFRTKICFMDLEGRNRRFVDLDFEWISGVTWSPDGTEVAFFDDHYPEGELYLIKTDGTGLKKIVDDVTYPDWGLVPER